MNSLAVKKGAEWLDATVPGWRSKINFDILDLRIWSKCILGQALGMSNLVKTPDLKEHGFFAHTAEDNQFMIEEWRNFVNGSA
jgi:hypothetical protein